MERGEARSGAPNSDFDIDLSAERGEARSGVPNSDFDIDLASGRGGGSNQGSSQGSKGSGTGSPSSGRSPSPPTHPTATCTTCSTVAGAEDPVVVDLSACRYDTVRRCAEAEGWRVAGDGDDEWDVRWLDTSVGEERAQQVAVTPRMLNHFPAARCLCRKADLAALLRRAARRFPAQFAHAPGSFTSVAQWAAERERSPGAVAIVKPTAACQGKGIALWRHPPAGAYGAHSVVQRYVDRPLLVDGRKCDLRCYLLVLAVHPSPVVYLHEEGLVRIAAEPYERPGSDGGPGALLRPCAHLTNYAVNSRSPGFAAPDPAGESGGKRSFRWLWRWLAERHGPQAAAAARGAVARALLHTVLAASGQLRSAYVGCQLHRGPPRRRCFEILGADVMLDDDLSPWLLEVNHSPSWLTPTPFDVEVKGRVLRGAMRIVAEQRRRDAAAAELWSYSPAGGRGAEEGGESPPPGGAGGWEPLFPVPGAAAGAELRREAAEIEEWSRAGAFTRQRFRWDRARRCP